MPNHYFQFKQFTVYQDKCAMKVGTDGVLLGAWAEVENARRILDIGTGTGLIALMLAQRTRAEIVAIDIDGEAVGQARENVERSPWSTQIRVEQQDIVTFEEETFDVIVSNPPYFQENTFCPDNQRNQARHTDGLSFEELLRAADRLLSASGTFSVILPTSAAAGFIQLASVCHLYPHTQTWICTKPDVAPKRVLLAFGRQIKMCSTHKLIVELTRHVYSPEYIALTREYYLKM